LQNAAIIRRDSVVGAVPVGLWQNSLNRNVRLGRLGNAEKSPASIFLIQHHFASHRRRIASGEFRGGSRQRKPAPPAETQQKIA